MKTNLLTIILILSCCPLASLATDDEFIQFQKDAALFDGKKAEAARNMLKAIDGQSTGEIEKATSLAIQNGYLDVALVALHGPNPSAPIGAAHVLSSVKHPDITSALITRFTRSEWGVGGSFAELAAQQTREAIEDSLEKILGKRADSKMIHGGKVAFYKKAYAEAYHQPFPLLPGEEPLVGGLKGLIIEELQTKSRPEIYTDCFLLVMGLLAGIALIWWILWRWLYRKH